MLVDLFKVLHLPVLLLKDLLETDNKRKKKRLKVKYHYNKIKEEVI